MQRKSCIESIVYDYYALCWVNIDAFSNIKKNHRKVYDVQFCAYFQGEKLIDSIFGKIGKRK